AGSLPRSAQASGPATIVPFSTSTASLVSGATAGSRSTLPLVASNSLPWQGQISLVPSSLLMAHRAWVQMVLYAASVPSSPRLTTALWSRYSFAPPRATSFSAPSSTGPVGTAGLLSPPAQAVRPSPATGVRATPRRTVRRLAAGRPGMVSPGSGVGHRDDTGR